MPPPPNLPLRKASTALELFFDRKGEQLEDPFENPTRLPFFVGVEAKDGIIGTTDIRSGPAT